MELRRTGSGDRSALETAFAVQSAEETLRQQVAKLNAFDKFLFLNLHGSTVQSFEIRQVH